MTTAPFGDWDWDWDWRRTLLRTLTLLATYARKGSRSNAFSRYEQA